MFLYHAGGKSPFISHDKALLAIIAIFCLWLFCTHFFHLHHPTVSKEPFIFFIRRHGMGKFSYSPDSFLRNLNINYQWAFENKKKNKKKNKKHPHHVPYQIIIGWCTFRHLTVLFWVSSHFLLCDWFIYLYLHTGITTHQGVYLREVRKPRAFKQSGCGRLMANGDYWGLTLSVLDFLAFITHYIPMID